MTLERVCRKCSAGFRSSDEKTVFCPTCGVMFREYLKHSKSLPPWREGRFSGMGKGWSGALAGAWRDMHPRGEQ